MAWNAGKFLYDKATTYQIKKQNDKYIWLDIDTGDWTFHHIGFWFASEYENLNIKNKSKLKSFVVNNFWNDKDKRDKSYFPTSETEIVWEGTTIKLKTILKGDKDSRVVKYSVGFENQSFDMVIKFVRFVTDYYKNKSKDCRSIYEFNNQTWEIESPIQERFYTPHEAIESELIADVDDYFKNLEEYKRLKLPSKRGYLLVSEPGTGKSTLINYLAWKYQQNIAILRPSKLSDSSFQAAVSRLPDNSILVIEDFDCSGSVTTRDNEPKESTSIEIKIEQLTMSGVLNALDGINQGASRLTFLTTNKETEIDPAIKRPGRIDKIIHVPKASEKQIAEYGKHIGVAFDAAQLTEICNSGRTMAEIQEYLLTIFRLELKK